MINLKKIKNKFKIVIDGEVIDVKAELGLG